MSQRYLVRRVTCLGDVLLSLHVCSGLKRGHPACHVTFCTASQYAEVARHCPGVDEVVIDGDCSPAGFSQVLDLDGDHRFDHVAGEGELERIDLIARVTRLPLVCGPAPYEVTDSERAKARAFVAASGVGPDALLVGVAPHSSSGKRGRSGEATRGLVRDLLGEVPEALVVLIDGAASAWPELSVEPGRMVDACGRLPLPVVGALLGELDLLITCDSGPLHYAAISGTPQVAFFSEIHPQARLSGYENVVPAYTAAACEHWPCGYYRHCGRGQACINEVRYGDISWAVREVLQARAQGRRPMLDVEPGRFCLTYIGDLAPDRELAALIRWYEKTCGPSEGTSLLLVTPNDVPVWPSRAMDAARCVWRTARWRELVWKRVPREGEARGRYASRAEACGLVLTAADLADPSVWERLSAAVARRADRQDALDPQGGEPSCHLERGQV